jgi:two-component system sensor histidine kinase KdpD
MNAAIYTPSRSAIRLNVQLHKTDVSIAVEDRGPGIREESIPHLFDKFYRVPGSPAGGTGLGLSIVKGIVEFHLGRVKAENNPAGGAKFTITLPLGEPPRGPDEPER